MKKLEDFECSKIELSSIYGGRTAAHSDTTTLTIYSGGGGSTDDGDDSDWETP